jgi:microcystin-dependent protein
MPIVENQALFALIGNRFGGDGRSTFGLPDLRKDSPNPDLAYYIALEGVFPSRS